jgi:hypothetical protein
MFEFFYENNKYYTMTKIYFVIKLKLIISLRVSQKMFHLLLNNTYLIKFLMFLFKSLLIIINKTI